MNDELFYFPPPLSLSRKVIPDCLGIFLYPIYLLFPTSLKGLNLFPFNWTKVKRIGLKVKEESWESWGE